MSCGHWLTVMIGLAATWGSIQPQAAKVRQLQGGDDRLESARQLAGFEPSEAALIEDHLPFTWNDETLVRLLYRGPKIPAAQLAELAHPFDDAAWQSLAANPCAHRFAVFRVVGTLVRLEPVPSTVGDISQLPESYLCWVDVAGRTLRVVVNEIPKALLDGGLLDQPVSAFAFFARLNSPAGGDEPLEGTNETLEKPTTEFIPLMVGPRLAWNPDRLDPSRGIGPGQLALAAQGFDVGLLDIVRRQNRQPMTRLDSPAFHAMLSATAAVARQTPDTLPKGGGPAFLTVIGQSHQHVGDWVEWEADVRRITSWEFDDGRGNFSRYYQLAAFVPLGNASIRLRDADGKELLFRGRFPVTCHVPDFVVGESELMGRRVVIRGFFYRLWSYESTFADEQQLGGGQLSPLILAADVFPIKIDETALGWWLTATMVGLLAVVLALVGTYLWFDRRQSRPRRLPERVILP